MKQRRQHVWLVRYGKTEFPLVENTGPYNSDIDPVDGVMAAEAIGNFLASYISKDSKARVVVYSSPFRRTTHTASIIASNIEGASPVRIEDGLYEWLTPSLLVDLDGVRTWPETTEELKAIFNNIDDSYVSVNPLTNASSPTPNESNFSCVEDGVPIYPESIHSLVVRCSATLQLILSSLETDNNDDVEEEHIILVSHAPCVQAVAHYMMTDHCDEKSEGEKPGPWALGGVTKFSRPIQSEYGKWQLDMYNNTDHMPEPYKVGMGLWSLPCFRQC